MTRLMLLTALLLVLAAGCAEQKATVEKTEVPSPREVTKATTGPAAEPTTEASAGSERADAGDAPSHSCASSQVFEGRVTVRGRVGSTKGAQLMLSGMLLQMPEPKGASRHEMHRAWVGRDVVLEADRCVYYCEPQAQCLTSGQIPSLVDVRILEGTPAGDADQGERPAATP